MKKWGALAVAVLGAAVMLVSSAGAAEQTLAAKLSTRTGANLYLVQRGLNPTGFVIQRGTHNYAGPNCPGKGWNCTTSKRVLQVGNQANQANEAFCSGVGIVVDSPTDCEIVQSNNDGSNTASCDQSSSSATVSQRCVIFQTSTGGGSNDATVGQVISASAGSTQNVHQYVGINQQNTTGSNFVHNGATSGDLSVMQSIGLSVSGARTETQDALQELSLTQKATSGNNSTDELVQELTENAQYNATDGEVIQQKQNTAATSPNTNAGISQTTNSGSNTASLTQTHNLTELATGDSTGIVQVQGAERGGINSNVNQQDDLGGGTSIFQGVQNESQHENVDGGTIKGQTQIGPMWGDPQSSDPFDSFNLDQSSNQHNSTGGQHDEMYLSCETAGGCDGGQNMTQNGGQNSDGCGGTPCNLAMIDRVSSDCGPSPCTAFPPPPDPPTKPQGGGGGPTCVLTDTITGPPKQIKIEVQDSSGVSNINVDQSSNATVDIPAGYQGSTDPIMVTASKTDQTQGSFVRLTVTNGNGDQTTCDPIVPAVHKQAATKAKPAKLRVAKAKGLTLKLDAGRLAYGQPKELTVVGSVPTGKAGEKVALLTATCGFKGAATLATLTTGPGGVFRYKLSPALGAAFAVRWNGITTPMKAVRVQPQIALVKAGAGRYRVDVSTTNGVFLTGTKAAVQALTGGHWKTIATGKLAPNSPVDVMTAVSSATVKAAGKQLRAVVPATTCYSSAASR